MKHQSRPTNAQQGVGLAFDQMGAVLREASNDGEFWLAYHGLLYWLIMAHHESPDDVRSPWPSVRSRASYCRFRTALDALVGPMTDFNEDLNRIAEENRAIQNATDERTDRHDGQADR